MTNGGHPEGGAGPAIAEANPPRVPVEAKLKTTGKDGNGSSDAGLLPAESDLVKKPRQ